MTELPRRLAALAAAAMLLLGACSGTDTVVFEQYTPAESATFLAEPADGLVVLDVRTPDEFASGHLADAVNVDFYEPDFRDRLADLDRDVPYFVYCRSGNRSGTTVEQMKGLGFTEVYELAGGLEAWSGAGYDTER